MGFGSNEIDDNESDSVQNMPDNAKGPNKHDENTPLLIKKDHAQEGDDKGIHRSSLSRYVVVVTVFAAIGGLLFGYDTGVVGGALPLLRERFDLDSKLQEFVVSGAVAGAIPGAICGGYLNDVFGRRLTIVISSIVFLVGSIVMAVAMDTSTLIVGRFIAGLGIGFASFSTPMYIAECSPVDMRGTLVTTNNLFITGGQVLSSLIDAALSKSPSGWRYMLGFAGVPAFVQLVGVVFLLKESPRYLVQRGRHKEAQSVFGKIYGLKDEQAASERNANALLQVQKAMEVCEILLLLIPLSSFSDSLFLLPRHPVHQGQDVKSEISTSTQEKTTLCDQLAAIGESYALRKALLLGCILQALQQLTGINTIIYYSATILQQAGLIEASIAIWYSVLVTTANFLFTIIGLWAVERYGRRRLTLVSLSGVILALFILAGSFALEDKATAAVPVKGQDQCGHVDNCKACIEHPGCVFKPSTKSDAYRGLCIGASSSKNDSHTTKFCPNKYWMLSLTGLILYLAFFAPGMGPMPWTVTSELYPLRVRSLCTSITAGVNWTSNFLVSMTFLTLCRAVTEKFAFCIYGSVGMCGWLYLFWYMPESRGVKLEAVQSLFERSDNEDSFCAGSSTSAGSLHSRRSLWKQAA